MKHTKFTVGRYTYDIDKMSSKELNKAIKKFSSMANTRIRNLKREQLYEFSNTIGRFHEPRLQKDFVGTKKGMFRTNVSGNLEQRRDRLQYMLAFITDPQTDVRAVKEYARDDIHYLFGADVDLSTKAKMKPYLETLSKIYEAYRNLGFDRGWKDSQSIITNMAKIIQDNDTELSPDEISTKMANLMSDAAKMGYTLDDISDFFSGEDIAGGSKTENLRQFLMGNLHLTGKIHNSVSGESPLGLHMTSKYHTGRGGL